MPRNLNLFTYNTYLLTSDICSFMLSRNNGLETNHSRSFFSLSEKFKRSEEKYFPLFPSKSCNNCLLFLLTISMLNVELIKQCTYEGGGRVGGVRLFEN